MELVRALLGEEEQEAGPRGGGGREGQMQQGHKASGVVRGRRNAAEEFSEEGESSGGGGWQWRPSKRVSAGVRDGVRVGPERERGGKYGCYGMGGGEKAAAKYVSVVMCMEGNKLSQSSR